MDPKGTIRKDINYTPGIAFFDEQTETFHNVNENHPLPIKITGAKTGGNGKITVGLTAVQLPEHDCDAVEILNLTNGAKIYYGWDNTLTVANGMGELEFQDSAELKRSNTNQVWLISDTVDTDVRFEWIKY